MAKKTSNTRRGGSVDILIAFAVIGAVILIGTTAASGAGAVSIIAGRSYIFIIRLDAHESVVSSVLESKGATRIEYGAATNPPFWAGAEPWSQRIVSFRVTPAGNSTVTMGDPFYGLGRIERIISL